MPRDDSQLIQACLDGDNGAWKELVERYGRLVYSIPIRYGFSSADADEVFQNVFVIVFRQLRKLRQQAALAAWLITMSGPDKVAVSPEGTRSGPKLTLLVATLVLLVSRLSATVLSASSNART